jgi:hypothetical protein
MDCQVPTLQGIIGVQPPTGTYIHGTVRPCCTVVGGERLLFVVMAVDVDTLSAVITIGTERDGEGSGKTPRHGLF